MFKVKMSISIKYFKQYKYNIKNYVKLKVINPFSLVIVIEIQIYYIINPSIIFNYIN